MQEFLDTEWYGDRRFQLRLEPRDLWKTGPWADVSLEVPFDLAWKLGQVDRLNDLAISDLDKILEVECSLRERGFDDPLLTVIDKHGRMVLKDGHHRLIAASRIGLRAVPMRFKESERIKSASAASVASMLPSMLLSVGLK